MAAATAAVKAAHDAGDSDDAAANKSRAVQYYVKVNTDEFAGGAIRGTLHE